MPITKLFRDRLLLAATLNPAQQAIGLPPQTLPAGATVGAARDLVAWPTVVGLTVFTGALTGGAPTLTVLVEESTTGAGSWTTAYTTAALAAANTITRATFSRTKRYVRATGTVGGTGPPTALASVTFESGAPAALGAGAAWLGLYTSIAAAGLDTLVTALTLPATSVAALQPISAFGRPYTRSDGTRTVDGPKLVFRPGSSADASSVSGWYIVDAATGGALLQWGDFGRVVGLGDEQKAMTVVVRPCISQLGQWDVSVSFGS